MTLHIRIDECEKLGEYLMRCGLTKLPEGDKYLFDGEAGAYWHADCHGCNPGGPKSPGVPISQLSGRPGYRGFDAFCDIAASWGYE